MGEHFLNIRNKDMWGTAPFLEVDLHLRDRQLADLSDSEASALLDGLRIEGPYPKVEDLDIFVRRVINWRELKHTYGVWELEPGCRMGVHLFPPCQDYDSAKSLVLAIPFAHAEFCFPYFTLQLEVGSVSDGYVNFHRLVIKRLREVNRHVALRAALIQYEGYFRSVLPDDDGILIGTNVAERLGFTEKTPSRLITVPWEEGGSARMRPAREPKG
jgi:hypothetical protein